jgi:molybdopterin synthase catalytic subunit
MFRITSDPLDPDALRRELPDSRAGAYVAFEGRVRSRNAGREVRSLEYETYLELAEKEGARVLAEARARFAVLSAACVHRVGHLQVGELAVWVGVTAEHRGAAFDACRYIVDEMKVHVPIWKKEHYASGAPAWVAGERGRATQPPDPERKL